MAAHVRTSWNPNKPHSDRGRWICIYPAYIDKNKTRAEGRRIPKNRAVDHPTFAEMRDVLSSVNVNIGVENKLYPREPSKELEFRGRIRVQLKNDDGTLVNPSFPTRESFFFYLAEKIPQLKTRSQKPSVEGQSASRQGQTSGNSKKKGKGGRR